MQKNNQPVVVQYKPKKKFYQKWWFLMLLIFFGIAAIGSSTRTSVTNNNSSNDQQIIKQDNNNKPLDITASHDTLAMYMTNNEATDLTGCKFTLNNDYKYESSTTFLMTAGQKGEFYLSDFTKSDGTRFNVYQTKPQYLSVLCHRPDGSSDFADIFWD
jgi:uncharacterized protein YpmS